MARACIKFAAFSVIAIGGCSFEEPDAEDATPIMGCYLSEGAPKIVVDPDSLEITGVTGTVSYRYEYRKVGPVIRAPLDAQILDGQPMFERSEDHFFPVLFIEGEPLLRIAFGPEGLIYDYRRVTDQECRS